MSWTGLFTDPLGAAARLFNVVVGMKPLDVARESMDWRSHPIAPTPADACVRLRLWNVKGDLWYYDHMKTFGYKEERAREILESNRTYQDVSSIIRWGWRNDKSDWEIKDNLVKHGWEENEAERMVEVAKFYPSPQDLITWQAKEVFEPAMISHYGLGAEFEELDLSGFRGAGVNEEQARNYWIAHWEHPSFRQLQEMLFRVPEVDEEEVKKWFRLMEIPPYWRQHMIDTAYHPYTRVDVRRMHKIGVFGSGPEADKKLRKAYTDIGFHGEQADNMVVFTKKYNKGSGESAERDLTRSMITKAYDVGYIDRGKCNELLSGMGYDNYEVEFIRGCIDEEKAIQYGGDWLSLLKNQLSAGLKTRSEVEQKLADLGFSSEAVGHYAGLFESWAEEPTKTPSKTDVKNFMTHEIITEADAREYLKHMGYPTDLIDNYILDWVGGPERYEAWREKQKEIEERLRGGV